MSLIIKNNTRPNITTAFLGLISIILNAASHILMTNKNFADNILPVGLILNSLLMYLLVARQQKRFFAADKFDSRCRDLSLALAFISICWYATSNHALANGLLQIILTITYFPTLVGIVKGRVREYWPAWTPGIFSFLIQIYIIRSGFIVDEISRVAFIFPIRGLVLIIITVILAMIYPNRHLIGKSIV